MVYVGDIQGFKPKDIKGKMVYVIQGFKPKDDIFNEATPCFFIFKNTKNFFYFFRNFSKKKA